MKQKYSMLKSDDKLTLKEFAELDKDIMSLLCEETYDIENLEAAIAKGRDVLVKTLRTRNMYPPGVYVAQIADSISTLVGDKERPSAELEFEDKELFIKEAEVEVPEEEDAEEDENVGVDDLLEEKIDDEYEEKKIIKKLKTSMKTVDGDGSMSDE